MCLIYWITEVFVKWSWLHWLQTGQADYYCKRHLQASRLRRANVFLNFPMYFLVLRMLLATWNCCQRRESLKEQCGVPRTRINGSGKGISDPLTQSAADAWLICTWKPPTTEFLISSELILLCFAFPTFLICRLPWDSPQGCAALSRTLPNLLQGRCPLPSAGACRGYTEYRQPGRWG